jgi:chemotaxis protein CheZ
MAPPQRSVFTAEKLLIREGKMPANGHAASANGKLGAFARPAAGSAPAEMGADATAAIAALRADIADLGKKIDGMGAAAANAVPGVDAADIQSIRNEVHGIAARIEQTKREIGALRHPLATEDKLASASMELSSVVTQTETATSQIFDGVEKIEEIARELRTMQIDEYGQQRIAEISDMCTSIIEACSFQDLTGQRINKVVRTIAYIEDRVQKMMEIWGADEFKRVPLPEANGIEIKDVGGVVLHGPQDADKTNSQSDIDKLFD